MLCNNCHSSNVAGARFCSTCGAALSDDYQDVVTKGVEGEEEIENENENENVYGYDDGFSVKQSDIKEQRKDYEYYPDDNGAQNVGYNNGYNGGYGNNAWNGGYNSNGYNGSYGNNGYNYNNNNAWNAGGNGYNGGYNNGYNYNYNYGYGETPLRQNTRSAGAIVIYMISGALALLSMLLPILPNVKVTDRNVFKIAYDFLDSRSFFGSVSTNDDKVTGVLIIMMFVLPMLFQLLWAIFSFCRVRAAGAMGLIGSIIYTTVGSYWYLFLTGEVKIGNNYFIGSNKLITYIPHLIIALGVTGIVFSSIEIAKRNRVR